MGVHDIVVSPGSRSQALALVAAELERVDAASLHVRIDERVAGFLALGLAIESGLPAIVITTSGTAIANLHPAVLEADQGRLPMLVLTADRPAELQGIRANQTTRQFGIYGAAPRLAEDISAPVGAEDEADAAVSLARRAFAAAIGVSTELPGPVHLNLAFRKPLSAPVPDLTALAAAVEALSVGESVSPVTSASSVAATPITARSVTARSVSGGGSWQPLVRVSAGPRTVVVAGHGAGPAAEEFARAGGWPLIAEVSSGSHFGPNLVVAYRELLNEPEFGGRVQRVIVFGHPTLSREVPLLISRTGADAIVVNPPNTEFYNPGHHVSRVAGAVVPDPELDPGDRLARDWLGSWVFASRGILDAARQAEPDQPPDIASSRTGNLAARNAFIRAELAAVRRPVTRRMLATAVWRATWPHDRLVFGASRLIREADGLVPGKKISVHANRGLSGIDGTVATAIGIARVSQDGYRAANESAKTRSAAAGVTRVLLGDLALLHDAGAMLFAPGEPRPRIQLIVGNDGGGTIFDGLEVASTASAHAIDRVLYTPQDADLHSLAVTYGWQYAHAATRGELDAALTTPITGPSLLEVPLAR